VPASVRRVRVQGEGRAAVPRVEDDMVHGTQSESVKPTLEAGRVKPQPSGRGAVGEPTKSTGIDRSRP